MESQYYVEFTTFDYQADCLQYTDFGADSGACLLVRQLSIAACRVVAPHHWKIRHRSKFCVRIRTNKGLQTQLLTKLSLPYYLFASPVRLVRFVTDRM